MSDILAKTKKALWIASPAEDAKKARARQVAEESFQAAIYSGAITCAVTTAATLFSVRKFAWAKANINPTGQALIITAATVTAFYVTIDKTVHKAAMVDRKVDRKK